MMIAVAADYSLAKSIWTHADFEEMGWHDVTVHAMALEPADTHPGSLAFDLDYIVEWMAPERSGDPYRFRVAPATLMFPMAWDMKLEASTGSMVNQLEIDEIARVPIQVPSGKDGFFHWTVAGHNFSVEFDAGGFEQHFRGTVMVTNRQSLTFDERGGVSFAMQSDDS